MPERTHVAHSADTTGRPDYRWPEPPVTDIDPPRAPPVPRPSDGDRAGDPAARGVRGLAVRLAQRWLPGWGAEAHGVRLDPGRRGWITLACTAAAGVVLVGVIAWNERPVPEPVPKLIPAAAHAPPAGPAAPSTPHRKPHHERIVLSVVGKVAHPGLVHVRKGARVADALEAAGQPLPNTDVTTLNLARHVVDGEQLYVGIPKPPGVSGASTGSSAASGAAGGASGRGKQAGKAIDLNSASADQLTELDGVGKTTAQHIIQWRSQHGGFSSVDQLRRVDGIGQKRLAQLRDQVRA